MSQFGAPSFSLGLDLDLDADLDGAGGASTSAAPTFRMLDSEDDGGDGLGPDEFDLGRIERDPPQPALKRLRRGPPVKSPLSAPPLMQSVPGMNVEEEIEEFSSDGDGPCVAGSCTTTRNRFLNGTSKLSLSRHRLVSSKDSTANFDCRESSIGFDSFPARKCIPKEGQGILPKLTVSPLRKIQFLDSDSDDNPSSGKCNQHKNNEVDPTGEVIRNSLTSGNFGRNVTQKEIHQKPLGDFATPIMDSFCEEYFASMNGNGKKVSQVNKYDMGSNMPKSNLDCLGRPTESNIPTFNFNGVTDHSWSSSNCIAPCINYYNHMDSRICELVQNRLPNFAPIGFENREGSSQKSGLANIDYMTQFLRRDTPANHASKNNGSILTTKKRNRKSKSVKLIEPQNSGDWVNPKDSSPIPLDAAKRRVHANANTRGHWFTSQDGRKVYISKTGLELSGQAAYRHYRKESGMGFKKSGKKSVSKKRTKKK